MTQSADRPHQPRDTLSQRRIDGVYIQSGTAERLMVRVRGTAARWTSEQLRAVSSLAARFGDGSVHITTRGDLELHGVDQSNLDTLLAHLAATGLATRGACGDTVRNVTACAGSGICPHERLDAGSFAAEIARAFTCSPAYERLPRKFKISVSGCERACALPLIQDIGIVAEPRRRTETSEGAGFRIYLAGGLGRHPALGKKMPDLVTPTGLIPFVRAALDCYNELGDRAHRHRGRMKFLAEALGPQGLLTTILERLETAAWSYEI